MTKISSEVVKGLRVGGQGQGHVNWSSGTRTFLEDNNTGLAKNGVLTYTKQSVISDISKYAVLQHNLVHGGNNQIYGRCDHTNGLFAEWQTLTMFEDFVVQGQGLVNWSSRTRTFLADNKTENIFVEYCRQELN